MLSGNEALYRRLLKKLLRQIENDFRPTLGRIQEASPEPLDARLAALQSASHNLKGVAGSLGLISLSEQASTLDRILKQGRLPPLAICETFNTTLQQAVTTIEMWLTAEQPVTPAAPDIDCSTIDQTLIDTLQSLLIAVKNNLYVEDARIQAAGQHLPTAFRAEWQAFVDAMDEFEFAHAERILVPLLHTLTTHIKK